MSSALRTIGWGIFCACSWTWCIGMFLPVIMLERFGWAGFLVFAVPNVIGCAAFGYVLSPSPHGRGFAVRARLASKESSPSPPAPLPEGEGGSARIMREHHAAVRWFSIITLAYHVFFIGFIAWTLTPLLLDDRLLLAIIAPLALLAISAMLSELPQRLWLPFAAIIYAVSLAVFASIGIAPLREIPFAHDETLLGVDGLLWLAPAIGFGFLLCPYLDATFHRAIQSSPSRHSFAIFGITFTVMIVLTATYWDALTTGLPWIVLAHITAQSIFTMAAHQRELRAQQPRSRNIKGSTTAGSLRDSGRIPRMTYLLVPLLALPLAFVGDGVEMYLRFLVFYGLVFPAYVVLFMSPLAPPTLRSSRLLLFAVVMITAAPFYEVAFIRGLTALAIVPPVAITAWAVLAARRRAAT